MGGAAAAELARRGHRIIGFDRFAPPHELGSSHGQTRIIREAYFEHPVYVPMVQRAYTLWRALERDAQATLLRETGGLMIGRRDSALVGGALLSAETHRLPHEIVDAQAVRRRYPALAPDDDMVAVSEPRAGVLFVERCIEAQLRVAERSGAELHVDERVLSWSEDREGVRVSTPGREVRARRLIIAAGAWTPALLGPVRSPLAIERQVLHFFVPSQPADFAPERLPIHLWQFDSARFFYGFPDLGNGVKAGFHHDGEATSPQAVRRAVDRSEIEAVRHVLRRFLPAADGAPRASTVCLYTNTPDSHFLIDRHPQARNVVVASACSGHGFKFAPAIGQILADLVEERRPAFDLELFRWRWN